MPRVHYYSTRFFGQILDDSKYGGFGLRGTLPDSSNKLWDLTKEEQPLGFREVQDWSNNIDNNMFELNNLFVPIDMNNVHWLFLCVDFREKGIRLYNSLGVNLKDRKYLTLMQKYLYSVEFKSTSTNSRPDFKELKLSWMIEDTSCLSPRQHNLMTAGYSHFFLSTCSPGVCRSQD